MSFEEEKQSDYGKGFIYCLILFAKHWWRHFDDLKAYKDIGEPEERAFSSWFHGAADHLIEMEVPEKLQETPIGKIATELRTLVLARRLPCGGQKGADLEDFNRAVELTEQIAVELDKYFGLDPIKADYA